MASRKLQKVVYESGYSYQVVLPKSLVESLGWKEGDQIGFYLQDGKLFIKKKETEE